MENAELLKENEQLKITIDRIKTEDEVKGYEINKVKALNTELLGVLKETERYFTKRSGKGKMAKRVEALVISAISKVEVK